MTDISKYNLSENPIIYVDVGGSGGPVYMLGLAENCIFHTF